MVLNPEVPSPSPSGFHEPGTPAPPGAALRVSVVIPLYNHVRYIEAAIHSVLAQTAPPAEIIVIDDGSVDGSGEKVRQLCKDHPEIIFWSWPNQGAHHTLNAGILRATGDFVAILNSDDCYAPDRLAACLAVVRADPSVDVVATGASFLDDLGLPVANPWYDEALAFYRKEGDLALGLFHANFLVTTSNLFIRRSLFESIGYFSPLRYAHDLEFCLRLVLGKRHLHFLDSPLVAYRLHGSNTISENKAREDIERAAVFAFFLYRQWRGDGTDETQRSALDRYAEVLGEQDLLGIVEDFLALLEGNQPQADRATSGPLPTEFLAFLSRLGVDWAAQGSSDPWLARFIAARNVFLRRQKKAEGTPKRMAKLKADNEWLLEQRDAWEKTARTQEEQVKSLIKALEEMRTGNAWLLEQRDAWEKTARTQDEQVKSLTNALEEMRTGNAWLLEQRDAWETAARTLEERAKSTARALEEMRAGNAWLLGQRDAWERLATMSDGEVARCHAALNGLLSSRLFRLLVRTKLLELRHVPQDATASGRLDG